MSFRIFQKELGFRKIGGNKEAMTQRQLLLEQPHGRRKQMLTRIQVSVDDRAAIGPWVTTLATRLGYPLVDNFGSPLAYRLRSVSDETILPASGLFADARFPSGSRFVLELDTNETVSMRRYGQEANPGIHNPLSALRFSRRSLMSAGILTTFSLLGFGSGMTTAFAQRLFTQHRATTVPISIRHRIAPTPTIRENSDMGS